MSNLRYLTDWFSDRLGRLFPAARAEEEDFRLLQAGAPVLLLAALFVTQVYARDIAPILSLHNDPQLAQLRDERGRKIYPVLVEQDFNPEARTEQIRALSERTSQGMGGITALAGWNAVTNDDRMESPQNAGSQATPGQRPAPQQETSSPDRSSRRGETETEYTAEHTERQTERRREEESRETQETSQGSAASAPVRGQGQQFRIPSNYTFREDFRLRFDGSNLFAAPTLEFAGAEYFRNMIRTIRERFSPPGINYVHYDRAGYVMSQPIREQMVLVQFAIDPQGNVVDVRKKYSIGQERVDEACISALEGANFGPPPPEVLRNGNIFGIRFVFTNPLKR